MAIFGPINTKNLLYSAGDFQFIEPYEDSLGPEHGLSLIDACANSFSQALDSHKFAHSDDQGTWAVTWFE